MPETNDRMASTLDTLRSDVERTPLADSLTVRRRGDQRTRRQAVGGALAVVALVAGAAGIYGGLGGDDRATHIPATQSPTPEQTLALAADPFLQPADIGTVGPYEGMQVSPDPAAADQQLSQCVPTPSTLGAAETQSRFFYSDLDAVATEHVLRFADSGAAQAAADQLTQSFATCDPGDPGEVAVEDRAPAPVAGAEEADTALHASRTATPVQASEVSYYELGVAREGNVLVVLQWSSMGQPTDVDWVWDADRVTTAMDRAVG